MPRVRSNVARLKRKKQIMKAARGNFGGRSKLWKAAKETVERGWATPTAIARTRSASSADCGSCASTPPRISTR